MPRFSTVSHTMIRCRGVSYFLVIALFSLRSLQAKASCEVDYPETNYTLKLNSGCDEFDRQNCHPGSCVNLTSAVQGVSCICNPRTHSRFTSFDERNKTYRVFCWKRRGNACRRCHERHTLQCRIAGRRPKCFCASRYNPHDLCRTPVNPCRQLTIHSFNGDEACGVENGNLCFPALDTAFYCVCRKPFTTEPSLGYPNCKKKTDDCHAVLCVQGRCNPRTATCDCYRGFHGPYCEQAWDSAVQMWSEWSVCFPACGSFGYKTSVRSCMSKVDSLFCAGTMKRWRRCLPQSCGFILGTGDLISLLKLSKKQMSYIIVIAIVGGLSVASILICVAEAMFARRHTFILGL